MRSTERIIGVDKNAVGRKQRTPKPSELGTFGMGPSWDWTASYSETEPMCPAWSAYAMSTMPSLGTSTSVRLPFPLANRVWELEEPAGLLESDQVNAMKNSGMKRGRYRNV
jgi:hypothetical protein